MQYAIKNFALFLKKIELNLDNYKIERALTVIKDINHQLKNYEINYEKQNIKFEFHPNTSLRLLPCSNIEVNLFKEQNNLHYLPFVDYQSFNE